MLGLEIMEDWVYQGLPLQGSDRNLGPETEKKFLKTLWHEVKQKTGKAITVMVDSKAGSDGTIRELVFIVGNYDIKKEKGKSVILKEPIASISLSCGGKGTRFVFNILDKCLAKTVGITLKALSDACQVTFSTVLIACESRDGNPPLDPIDEIAWRCKEETEEPDN